jgi:hypothetical protein
LRRTLATPKRSRFAPASKRSVDPSRVSVQASTARRSPAYGMLIVTALALLAGAFAGHLGTLVDQ